LVVGVDCVPEYGDEDLIPGAGDLDAGCEVRMREVMTDEGKEFRQREDDAGGNVVNRRWF
jgi:hypothetical protein